MPVTDTLILPASNTLEQNANIWAEYYNNAVESGQGLFIDFKKSPELKQPAINCLVNKYGWTLEKPFFIRKP